MRIVLTLLLLSFISAGAQDKKKEEAVKVLFSTLKDFKLPIKDPTFAEKEELGILIKSVPDKVLKLNGKRVKVAGFMVPLTLDKNNKVPLFLLAPDTTSCCYGNVPNLNGFIYCSGKIGFDYKNDIPIEVTGIIMTKPYYDKKEDCVLMFKLVPESIKVLKSLPGAKNAAKKPVADSSGKTDKKTPEKN